MLKTCLPWLVITGLMIIAHATAAQPLMPRTAPNLMAGPDLRTAKGWYFIRAKHIRNISQTAGSGAIRLDTRAFALSPKIPVQPDKPYTCSAMMRSDAWPPPVVRLAVQFFDGQHRAVDRRFGTNYGNSQPHLWEEATVFFHANPGEAYARLMFARLRNSTSPQAPIWIEHIYCGQGMSFAHPPSPKQPFDGTLIRVDALGNMQRADNGQFKPFFPRCIFTDRRRRDWSVYARQGFNCNMWAATLDDVKRGAEAGLYSAMPLAAFVDRDVKWGYRKFDRLRQNLRDILTHPVYRHWLLLYYLDNENNWEEWDAFGELFRLLDDLDRGPGGQRARPIYLLQGNAGATRMYQRRPPLANIAGTYIRGFTAGADSGPYGLTILDRIQGQKNPVVFAQMNLGVGEAFRPQLYAAVFKGGIKAFGFWRDWANRPGKQGLEQRPWWPGLPKLAAEIDRLMPLIREPHWTSWRAVPDTSHVTAATRDYQGEGYVILVNHQDQDMHAAVTFEGLPYQPAVLRDYLSDTAIAVSSANRAIIPLRRYGTGVYRLAR